MEKRTRSPGILRRNKLCLPDGLGPCITISGISLANIINYIGLIFSCILIKCKSINFLSFMWINDISAKNRANFLHSNSACYELTTDVLRSEYSRTRSIPLLLMSWLLVSPGHQQPWYWLHKIDRPLFSIRKDLDYLGYTIVEKWYQMQIFFKPIQQIMS